MVTLIASRRRCNLRAVRCPIGRLAYPENVAALALPNAAYNRVATDQLRY